VSRPTGPLYAGVPGRLVLRRGEGHALLDALRSTSSVGFHTVREEALRSFMVENVSTGPMDPR
jgi:hypothetical protein